MSANIKIKLSSYKLVAYLKEYVNPKGTKTPVKIQSRTARKWLNKLRYKYRHIGKNVFIDGHKQADIIDDRKKFLQIMEELEPYLVEFDEDGKMLPKSYLLDCEVGRNKRRPVIVITHDECTFSSNDSPRCGWQKDGDTFLRPKSKG